MTTTVAVAKPAIDSSDRRSIGRQIDQAQAEWLYALMLGMGFDAFRLPGVFGPAVPVATTGPAHLRLLGFLGREVASAAALPA